jgi:endonuclease/exonuclease/phosphatase family metal-dependent hydrolase
MKPWSARTRARVRSIAVFLGVAYPLTLVLLVVLMRCVGEGWAPTAVLLYLPRLGFAAPLPFVLLGLIAFQQRRLLWVQVGSVAVLVFFLMGFTLPWPHGADRAAPTLRVLSYNIDSARAGAERVVEEIDAHAPDIVLLQEVGNPTQVEALLRARYPVVESSTQFIVASKYPVVATTDPDKLPYDGRLRSPRYLERQFDTPLGHIAVYDVHPLSPRDSFLKIRGAGLRHEILSGRVFRSENARAVDENFGLRELQVETFARAAAAETVPVIIAGDTNLPGLSRTFGRHLSGYIDGFRSASWGFGYTYPVGKHWPWMRLDRVLATPELRFVRFEVGTSTASDHHCVVADLQLETR